MPKHNVTGRAGVDLAIMTEAFMHCAIWADLPEDAEPKCTADFAPSARRKAFDLCREFSAAVPSLITLALEAGHTWEQMGHDLWLTIQGHGAGFWDRSNLTDTLRDTLTALARLQPEVDLYVGDDGKLHLSVPKRKA